jgi:hypothetical protein
MVSTANFFYNLLTWNFLAGTILSNMYFLKKNMKLSKYIYNNNNSIVM